MEFHCKYQECSAYTGQGVRHAMFSAIYEILRPVEDFVNAFKEEMRV
jgi:hypothetical protein